MTSSHSSLWLTLLLLLSISCGSESTIPEISGYCANALALISAPDSLKVVELNYNLPEDSLLAWLEQNLGAELCEETYIGVSIPLPLADKAVIIKVRTDERCDTDPIYMRERNSFSIRINYAEQFLIENDPGTIDSIHSQIPAFYFNGHFDGMKEARTAYFSLKWDPVVRKETIEQVLTAIAQGYLNAAETFAQRRFKSDLCSLTSDQLLSVQKEFPFALEFQLAPLEILVRFPDVEADTVEDFL